MQNILETIIFVWSFLSIFWLISFFPFLRKKIKITDGGGEYESGRNVRVEKKLDGSYDVSSTPKYSYSGPTYAIKYNGLGIFFRGIGTGGIVSFILYMFKDFITELACLCTLGMIDVRENQTVVYGCILGIAIISSFMAGVSAYESSIFAEAHIKLKKFEEMIMK